jgi:hypothetical protein
VETLNFNFTPIQTLHRNRTRRIHAIIQPIARHVAGLCASSDAATDYCLAHHVLEGAEAVARDNQATALDWYRSHLDANALSISVPTDVGPRVVVAPRLDRLPSSGISDTPYYVLGPETITAPLELQQIVVTACSFAVAAGFGELLGAHAVVICLLRQRSLSDSLSSWTISRLPGTVFCDHVGDPILLARDLIHEAGHNWLNDALAATRCSVSDQASFYSPWKNTPRPVFGFLHACWAFPLTMIYTARILSQATGDLRGFLAAYLAQQRDLLAETTADHARALALVSNNDLRQRMHAVHHEALSL